MAALGLIKQSEGQHQNMRCDTLLLLSMERHQRLAVTMYGGWGPHS